MAAWGAAASVTMDHQALGEALGAAALNGVPAGGTVLLLDSLPGDNGIRERLRAAKAVLEREGRQVRICRWNCGSTSFADILRIERPSAVIAFEAAALGDMAELSTGAAPPPASPPRWRRGVLRPSPRSTCSPPDIWRWRQRQGWPGMRTGQGSPRWAFPSSGRKPCTTATTKSCCSL